MQLRRLAGSAAAASGYEHLGACAHVADDLLRTPQADAVQHDLLDRAVEAVLGELDRADVHVGERAPVHIVLVEDDPAQAELIAAELEAGRV